jgi:hypothetical protein
MSYQNQLKSIISATLWQGIHRPDWTKPVLTVSREIFAQRKNT